MPSSPFHRVTIVAGSSNRKAEREDVRQHLSQHTSDLEVRSVAAPLKRESFPLHKNHVILFTPTGVQLLTENCVTVLQSITESTPCRMYLMGSPDASWPPQTALIDHLIQRAPTHEISDVCRQAAEFFAEADSLTRYSNLKGARDAICIWSYNRLKLLSPASYVVASALVLNAVSDLFVFAGRPTWHPVLANPIALAIASFFGFFFCVHAVFATARNVLFASRIVRRLSTELVARLMVYAFAVAGVIYSILSVDQSWVAILGWIALAGVAYSSYLYSYRIRAECSSLSEMQSVMVDNHKRSRLTEAIGKAALGSAAFTLCEKRANLIFISYMKKSDWSQKAAMQLDTEWTQRGTRVFLDRSSIDSGAPWRQHLLRGVSECSCFVALLDGNTRESEWVLAESAYAAVLRKSIGKPKILLVMKNERGREQIQQGPFGDLYEDLFRQPQDLLFGAGILVTDDEPVSVDTLEKALRNIRPMRLLNC